jgi:uncharacterized membrane protein
MKFNSYNIMNILNWPKKQLLYLDLFFIVSVFSISYIDDNIVSLSYLRAFFWLLFLLFIPGLHLLRLLKIQNLDFLGSILFSFGLSLAILMGIGFILNFVIHLFSWGYPFSVNFILFAYVFILCLFLSFEYLNNSLLVNEEEKIQSGLNNWELKFQPSSLFLLLLPLLAIIGTHLFNYYNINQITLIFLFLASLLPIIVGYGKLPQHQYPLTIFMLSLSLLLHRALLSNYIWGWDIHIEYYIIKDIIETGFWNYSFPHHLYSMLSIVVIGPIFTSVMNLDPMWVIKLLYPIIFSIVPVGIYYLGSKITSKNIAFFSSVLCIAIPPFSLDMLQLARQQIAELFLVLFLVLLLCCEINKTKRMFIATIFICGIYFSHYGLATIMIIVLTIGVFLLYLNKLLERWNVDQYLQGNLLNDTSIKINEMLKFKQKTCTNIINTLFYPVALIFFFTWSIYLASGYFFYEIIRISENIFSVFFYEFGSAKESEALKVVQYTMNVQYFTHQITTILNYFTIFGLLVGILYFTLFYRKKNTEFWAICSGFFMILIFTVVIPRFSEQLLFSRFYQIALLPLSLLSIIGLSLTIYFIYSIFRSSVKFNYLKFLGIFFMFFILFNTGFIYAVLNDDSNSISLNKNLDFPLYSDSEVQGLAWADKNVIENNNVTYEYRLSMYYASLIIQKIKIKIASPSIVKTSDNYRSKEYFIGDSREDGSLRQKSDLIYNSHSIRVSRL